MVGYFFIELLYLYNIIKIVIMKALKIIIQSLVLIVFLSCQKEEMVIIDENNNETLTSVSPLTGLITRVSQNPTAIE